MGDELDISLLEADLVDHERLLDDLIPNMRPLIHEDN